MLEPLEVRHQKVKKSRLYCSKTTAFRDNKHKLDVEVGENTQGRRSSTLRQQNVLSWDSAVRGCLKFYF